MKVIISYHEKHLGDPAVYEETIHPSKFQSLPVPGEHLFYQNALWRVENYYYDMHDHKSVTKIILCKKA